MHYSCGQLTFFNAETMPGAFSLLNLLEIKLRAIQHTVQVRNFSEKSLLLQEVESKTDGNLIRALNGDAHSF